MQEASGTPARGGASCAYCRLACCESPLGLFCWYSFIWCCLIHSMVQFFGPLNWFYGKQLDSTPPKVTVSCSDHQQLGLVVQSQDPDSPETTAPFGSFLTIGVHCQV